MQKMIQSGPCELLVKCDFTYRIKKSVVASQQVITEGEYKLL